MTRRPARVIAAGSALLVGIVLPACGTDDGGRTAGPSTTGPPAVPAGIFRGSLRTGEPITVAIDGTGRVLVAWPSLRCRDEPPDEVVANEVDPADAGGALHGASFEATGAARRELPDGDARTVEAEVVGDATGTDALAGTVQVRRADLNGQAEALGDVGGPARCSSGDQPWTAARVPGGDPSSLFAFRDAAEGDLRSFEAMVAGGGDPAVMHPVRGTSLVENISEPCITRSTGSDLGWRSGADGDAPPFPAEGAEATIRALVARGVPLPACHPANGG
ncbi:hypothetical protein [Dermatobacter hominis]|uniref:hypothetical protein n=1 Tax=Dermatobacter hominis TaxID=2884263 RepID=UPI001D107D88|nr:hypothetical protein [Dermatobacter hominis]UDY35011.1 hypothetical protein LH044_16935 [Dermatobacter hominis]